MISSSVGFGHPGKYSYGIPHEYLSGQGNLLEKIISIKIITSLIWDFYQTAMPRLAKIGQDNFFRTALFLKRLLLHTFSE